MYCSPSSQEDCQENKTNLLLLAGEGERKPQEILSLATSPVQGELHRRQRRNRKFHHPCSIHHQHHHHSHRHQVVLPSVSLVSTSTCSISLGEMKVLQSTLGSPSADASASASPTTCTFRCFASSLAQSSFSCALRFVNCWPRFPDQIQVESEKKTVNKIVSTSSTSICNHFASSSSSPPSSTHSSPAHWTRLLFCLFISFNFWIKGCSAKGTGVIGAAAGGSDSGGNTFFFFIFFSTCNREMHLSRALSLS